MAEGWIKLHRALLNKPIWKQSTPEQKAVLITLLMKANHNEEEWEWKGQKYKCKPGQLITSLNSLAQDAGVSVQNVRSSLKRFGKYEFLTNQSTNKNRLITIVNWGIYQAKETTSTKRPTKAQQRPNKGPTTNKNDKNDKNDKKKDIIGEFEQAILNFKEMRKEIKHPLTDKAEEMLRTKLSKMGDEQTQIAILNESTMKCWRGVFPLDRQIEKKEVKNADYSNYGEYADLVR